MQVLTESKRGDRLVAEDPLVSNVAHAADEEHGDCTGAQEDARRDLDVEHADLGDREGRLGSSRGVGGGDVADERAELEGANDCVEPQVDHAYPRHDRDRHVEHHVRVVNVFLRANKADS